jgi:hypothetical protein
MTDGANFPTVREAESLLGIGPDPEPVLSLEESINAFSATASRIADQLVDARREIVQLHVRNIVLLQALRRHGKHSPGCEYYKYYNPLGCTCGFTAALGETAQ